MKNCIFLIALFICANSIDMMAVDLSNVKKELNSARKELSSVTAKRDKAQKKHEQLRSDSIEATIKISEHQDKPKSLAYKNAVKKSETTNEKLQENAIVLTALNTKVDSLTNVVAIYEETLNNAPEVESTVSTSEQSVVDIQDEADAPVMSEDLQPVDHSSDAVACEEEAPASSSSTNNQPTSKDGGDGFKLLLILGLFILGIILGWLDFKKKHHCPNCGKWFTMESEGDTRVWDHDSRGNITKRGARKRYRCSSCGHETRFIEWFGKH